MLQGLSGDEETKQIEIFVEKIYNKSKYFNVPPENLVEIASEIWELSKTMPTREIISYLKTKVKEKEKLEGEINELSEKHEIAESAYNINLQMARTNAQELQNFIAARQYFEDRGVDINNLYQLTMALKNADLFNFDANLMAQRISGNESLIAEEAKLRRSIEQKREELKVVERTMQIAETDMDEAESKMKYSKELESMGFGLTELIEVKRMLVAIAGDNKTKDASQNRAEVVKSFFSRIEELRNAESKLEYLKQEIHYIEELRKSQLDEMEQFMGRVKDNIKELSGMAIQAEKSAFCKSEDVAASETSNESNSSEPKTN
jgi:hypothetical protein